ncbi:hypothetical protein [Amycolatopsis sp. DG1A-15b]|uniref:hypothetical protein n=1 Tax=Amycolatopsis sp. DG1A-15b TaxID=3052846 RepID=UPI00255BEF6B|nr:hypothetical protein [Amycolatopsis sp. DG1A-15b]WIX92443.1 hypothetical protein QRY02_19190 [Amycolatopsis sp. DG1A-15b]
MTDHPRRVTLHSQHRSVTLDPQSTGTGTALDLRAALTAALPPSRPLGHRDKESKAA